MDQDSDACPAVDRVQLEKVERPDGYAAEGFDDEPLLAGLKDVELLFLNEPFERVARKGASVPLTLHTAVSFSQAYIRSMSPGSKALSRVVRPSRFIRCR